MLKFDLQLSLESEHRQGILISSRILNNIKNGTLCNCEDVQNLVDYILKTDLMRFSATGRLIATLPLAGFAFCKQEGISDKNERQEIVEIFQETITSTLLIFLDESTVDSVIYREV